MQNHFEDVGEESPGRRRRVVQRRPVVERVRVVRTIEPSDHDLCWASAADILAALPMKGECKVEYAPETTYGPMLLVNSQIVRVQAHFKVGAEFTLSPLDVAFLAADLQGKVRVRVCMVDGRIAIKQ